MTNVRLTTTTRTVHTWHVPVGVTGYAVIGDIRDALRMASAAYSTMTGGDTDYDDWLKVTPLDDEILFWFEHPKQP